MWDIIKNLSYTMLSIKDNYDGEMNGDFFWETKINGVMLNVSKCGVTNGGY